MKHYNELTDKQKMDKIREMFIQSTAPLFGSYFPGNILYENAINSLIDLFSFFLVYSFPDKFKGLSEEEFVKIRDRELDKLVRYGTKHALEYINSLNDKK